MSGPWDRPSQDREPPAPDEDSAPERTDAGQAPGEGWPSSDLWSDQRPEAGSGWDDWSTLRAPDDFVLDEPVSTLGDPWAESWAEETGDREESRPLDEDRWTSEPAVDDGWTPPVDAAPAEDAPAATPAEPPVWEPEPATDPWSGPESADAAIVDEPEAAAPRVAPWQASDDPWAAVVEPEEPLAASEPVIEEEAPAAEAEPLAAEPEPSTAGPVAPEGEGEGEGESEGIAAAAATAPTEEPSSSGSWRRDLLPAWLTGRAASADADADADADAAPEAAAPDEPEAAESVPDVEPVAADELAPVAVPGEQFETAGDPGEDALAAPSESDEAESFVAVPDHAPAPAADEPAGPEPTMIPVPAVAWEDDAPSPAAENPPAAPADAFAAASDDDEADAAADAEAAAELEAPAAFSPDAWPETDIADAAPAASAEPDADERDRRFDAFLGASAIGAAAAAGAVDEPVVDEPVVEEPVVEEPMAEEPATLDAEPAVEPTATQLPASEAWVAEPEAWEPAEVVEDEPLPATPAMAEPAVPEAEVEDPAAAWRAAAAAAAAAAVVRTPEVQAPRAEVEQPAAPEAPEAPAADLDAPVPPGDNQPTWRPEWLPDVEEIEADERTSVLPTDWTPPPVPVQPADRSDLAPHAGATRTRPASEADRELDEEDEAEASTAEQAVPWLIGFILLLAGMVIVLLALIFAGDASLGGGSGEPTPQPSLAAGAAGSPQATPTPPASVAPTTAPASAGASASAAPSSDAVAVSSFGPLEMIYQGRAAALAPIYLLHREFTTQPEAAVLAQDPNLDLRRYGWAMDGTKGAGLYADLLVSIEPGVEKRQLADEIATVTFGPTAQTVYAVRVTPDGANDVAVVLAVDFASGDTTELARFTYPRPAPNAAAPLQQAQYEDEGGPVRLYWMEDNHLQLWVLNGGMWEIDPTSGEAAEIPRHPPVLWSPDGRNRIEVGESSGTTTLTWVDMDGDERSTTSVEGLVSHVRWSPESDRVVFTLGRSASAGGVLQDLWLWDLGDEPPTQITATGAAFGAEWMGARVRWRGDPG